MVYGYVRVSAKDQNEDRQIIAMREVGVSEKNIYMDKQSGKDFKRKQYKRRIRCGIPVVCCKPTGSNG